MDLITPRDILNLNKNYKYFGGIAFARFVMWFFRFNEFNRRFAKLNHLKDQKFLEEGLKELGVTFEVSEEDLARIPKEGPFITVSNHTYGALDGIILMRAIPPVRQDYKILVNFLLTKLTPISEYFIGVNPFETYKEVKSSFGGLKDAVLHVKNGYPLGIYPAGEVSSFDLDKGKITDRTWKHSIIRFIKKAQVPVVPVYFEGHNSTFFHILGFIHKELRTAKLPSEMFNKRGKNIRIRIGTPIPLAELEEYRDFNEFGDFLRTKTYALGASLIEKKKFPANLKSLPAIIAAEISADLLESEVNSLLPEFLLFRMKGTAVLCAPAHRLNHVMKEIGRLREITYREVGEGTGKSLDIDEYDPYFEQLFIWDEVEKRIIGGYRVGKGRDISRKYGMAGFYIQSLFRIDEEIRPIMELSLELGRSFIVKNYQRKTMSLFMLWKGILYFLLKNPEYRYLIGPVSISNDFMDISKALVVEFFRHNHFNTEFAQYVRPRKEFSYNMDVEIDREIFLKYTSNDLNRLDRFIQDIEPAFKTPILLKKYISLNAEVVSFNVDPKFSNCLDALIILDLFEVPFETIETLSKEINDQSILERFKK